MISSARERRLVHALEEIVGGDLALVGAAPSRRGRAPPRDSPPPDRCWRSSRRSCPCCAPGGRRCPARARASAGIAPFTVDDAATSAWRVIAPMTIASPSLLMPLSSAMPDRSTSVPGCASRSFIAPTRLWPPASALAAGLGERRGGLGDGLRAREFECVHGAVLLQRVALRATCAARCHTRCGDRRHVEVLDARARARRGSRSSPLPARRSRPLRRSPSRRADCACTA